MNRAGLVLLFLMWCGSAHCAFELLYSGFPPLDSRLQLTATASLPDANDVGISFGFSPSIFGISDLRSASLGITADVPWGSAYVSIHRTGFALYSEVLVRSGAVWSTGTLHAGAGISAFRVSIEGYGTAYSLGIDMALGVDLATDITWTSAALNVNGATLGRGRGELPQILSSALAYTLSSHVLVLLGISKDLHFPAETHLGVTLTPFPALALTCGLSTNPSRLQAGIRIGLPGAEINYEADTHGVLGLTHLVGLVLFPSSF